MALAGEWVDAGLLRPEWSGTVTPTELASLWSMFEAIGQWWALADAEPSEARRRVWFEEVVWLKTEPRPSYLGEYRNATTLMAAYHAALGPTAPLAALFSSPFSMREAPLTRLAHLRRYVVAELIQLHVVRGGLRGRGYHAHPGYQAGPLANKPYR